MYYILTIDLSLIYFLSRLLQRNVYFPVQYIVPILLLLMILSYSLEEICMKKMNKGPQNIASWPQIIINIVNKTQ